MSIESELKPCPFCGGEAKICKGKTVFWVYCLHCGVATENYETEQEAAEDWNTRKIEDAQAAEIKRLREALEEIKKEVEDAQDTIYPFHIALDSKDGVYILEVTKEALKEGKKDAE